MSSRNQNQNAEIHSSLPKHVINETNSNETSPLPHNSSDPGLPSQQCSGDYRTNPTTEDRYGSNVGTGVYNPNSHNVAQTTYTVKDSDFKNTAADSGVGIHSSQYRSGTSSDGVPVGHTTYIQETPIIHHVQDHPHVIGTEPRHEENLKEEREREYARQHREDQLERERINQEQAFHQNAQDEKVDTNVGSVHGLFGHGRHKDALLAGRDTDATDYGSNTSGKLDASRNLQATTGSEPHKLVGRVEGREKLAREQDLNMGRIPGAFETGDKSRLGDNSTSGIRGVGDNLAPGAAASGARNTTNPFVNNPSNPSNPITRDTGYPATTTAANTTSTTTPSENYGRTGASRIDQADQRDTNLNDEKDAKKPTLMDKVIGGTEAAIGKGTSNPTMVMKGEDRAAGYGKN